MQRILAISNHSDMLGGGEYSFLDLLSHLHAPWGALAVVPAEGELAARLRKKGIQTHVIPLPSIRPWNALNIISALKAYLNHCRQYRPALIYGNGSRAALYGGMIGRIIKLPTVWHCRIADSDLLLDWALTRLSTKVVTNSQATANRFKQCFQSKVAVVHNGVDISWFTDNSVPKPDLIRDEWKVILVVARASKWKRHDLALSAFELIANSNPDCHLVFLGAKDVCDLEWWNFLQHRTQRSAFSNRIHWIGQVQDVRPWYRAATLLVLASENEPFGRVLVEAMAYGVPVVATLCGGIPEIVRHGQDGILVEPGKVDQIVCAMEEILRDEPIRNRFSESARERAEFFSLDNHVRKMAQIFELSIKHPN